MRKRVIGAALLGLLQFSVASAALVFLADPALSQNNDLRPILDRLDRMERDMNQLQRQVYRGGSSGAPTPVAPADSGSSAVTAEIRMDQLEAQMRTLTGTLEEQTYNIDQLKIRLDKLVSDVDLRLTALEHPDAGGSAAAASGAQANAAPAPSAAPPARAAGTDQPTPPAGAGANPDAPASASGTLGTLSTGSGAQVASRMPAKPGGGPLPSGSAQDQYNYAFGLLRQADYPGAEEALRAFVQRYPNDALAGNAQYWLGETFYVRKDYNNAAAAFAEGYRKYPQSGKGADSLLKLGLSLSNVGQKKEACLTLGQLNHDFPNASTNIKERASQEKQHLGC
jgi:tol-pal system protein YbgF